MSAKSVQRGIVVALIVVTIGGALAAHFVSNHQLQSRRTEQASSAQQRIADALGRRAYYLEDLADMVGVHDDADISEFTRYAHVRGHDEDSDEASVVGVQWVRRSPTGRLVPAGDVPRGTKLATPILFNPTQRGNIALVDAATQPGAAQAIRIASLGSQLPYRPRYGSRTATPASISPCRWKRTALAESSRGSSHAAQSSA